MEKLKKIGLVVAMESEQQLMYNKLGKKLGEEVFGNIKITHFKFEDKDIFMADSGIGEISASLSTQLLIVKFEVEIIINFGVVGSLVRNLKCKDVVFVKEVVHYDFSLSASNDEYAGKYPFQRESFVFKADEKMLNFAKQVIGDLKTVRIATGDKFIDSSKTKNWLVEHFNCEICDMESMGIHLACLNSNIPYIMLKAVSDNADEGATESFEKTLSGGIDFYVEAVKKLLIAL